MSIYKTDKLSFENKQKNGKSIQKYGEKTVENEKGKALAELRGKTAAFLNLGCKVNSYETESMKQMFLEAGAEILPFEEKADIYIVNTCTVTNIADRKSRQMLRRAKQQNQQAIIVAVGCYAQESGDFLLENGIVDLVFGTNKKKDLLDAVAKGLKGKFVLDRSELTEYEELAAESIGEKTRAYLKIQDGCNQFCSYCVIPYVRGSVRSREKESIQKEVKHLLEKGFQEIVLTGIHLSSYGLDLKKEKDSYSLLSLIQDLCALEGLKRLRLGSLEPRIMTEEFVKALAEQKKICPHFHLSLQSGCDETLLRMNRKYTTKDYQKACRLLRSYFENPAITTDVIVGFPGETEEEFKKTKEFLEKISFAQLHIFKYSKREGTKAALMKEQVLEKEKTKRSLQLNELEQKMRKEYKLSFLDKMETILTEEIEWLNGEAYWVGYNERYVKIAVKSENLQSNQLVSVKIDSIFQENFLKGVL